MFSVDSFRIFRYRSFSMLLLLVFNLKREEKSKLYAIRIRAVVIMLHAVQHADLVNNNNDHL